MLADVLALVDADLDALVEALWLALVDADLEALVEALWLTAVEIELLSDMLSDVKSFKLLWTVSTVLSR